MTADIGSLALPRQTHPAAVLDVAVVEAAPVVTSPSRAVARWALASTALLALWLVLFVVVLSGVQEARAQAGLHRQLRQQLAEATAPVQAPIRVGAPVAALSIPALGMRDVVVVQGSGARQLASGPGHRPDSVLPGQAGVSVVLGRALSFAGPFARLPELQQGDTISATTGQGRFTYTVTRVRRAGDLVSPPAAGTGRLTLVTAEGSGTLGTWTPRGTVFVDAVLEKAAPAGRVAAAGPHDGVMRGDSGALVPLVLWLEALLGVALALVWGARRWGGRQAWLAGAGLLAAAVWGASESAWLLLPNLL